MQVIFHSQWTRRLHILYTLLCGRLNGDFSLHLQTQANALLVTRCHPTPSPLSFPFAEWKNMHAHTRSHTMLHIHAHTHTHTHAHTTYTCCVPLRHSNNTHVRIVVWDEWEEEEKMIVGFFFPFSICARQHPSSWTTFVVRNAPAWVAKRKRKKKGEIMLKRGRERDRYPVCQGFGR